MRTLQVYKAFSSTACGSGATATSGAMNVDHCADWENMTVYIKVTPASGTAGGTLTYSTSVDGTNYVNAASATTTVAANTWYATSFAPPACRYLKFAYTDTATVANTIDCYVVVPEEN